MTLKNKPLTEEKQTLGLILHNRIEPGTIDKPLDDPWMVDYLLDLAKTHPAGARWVWGYLPGSHGVAGWGVVERGCDGLMLAHPTGHLAFITGRNYGAHRYLRLMLATQGGEEPTQTALLGAKMALLPGIDGFQPFPAIERYPRVTEHALYLFFPVDGAPAVPDFRDRWAKW